MAERRDASADASEPRSSWVRPAEQETDTPVAEDAAEHETDTPVAEDAAEHETDTPVAEDAAEHETDTPVAEDAAEHETDTPVAEDAAEHEAATPVAEAPADEPAEEAGEPSAPAMHMEAPAGTPHVHEDGQTDAVSAVESQPELEEPVASRDQESPELDRPQPQAPAEAQIELMAVDSRKRYRARWDGIQTSFVDDPAQAVREADHLVADVMEHLATTFAEERGRLEERWSQGTEDTEHLRTALQRYRQFLGLLLEE